MIGSPTRQGAKQSTAHRDFRRLSTKQCYPPARVQRDFLPGGGLPGGHESRATDQGGQIYHRHRYKRAQPYTEPRPAPHNPITAEEITNGRRTRQFFRAILRARGYICNFREPLKKGALPAINAPPGGGLYILTGSANRDRRPALRKFSHNSNPEYIPGGGAEKRPKTARKWPEMLTKVDIKNTQRRAREKKRTINARSTHATR